MKIWIKDLEKGTLEKLEPFEDKDLEYTMAVELLPEIAPQHVARIKALAASGAEIVTVALRRVDLSAPSDNLLDAIDQEKYLLLPNTSGARDAEEAIRLARLARLALVLRGPDLLLRLGQRGLDRLRCRNQQVERFPTTITARGHDEC